MNGYHHFYETKEQQRREAATENDFYSDDETLPLKNGRRQSRSKATSSQTARPLTDNGGQRTGNSSSRKSNGSNGNGNGYYDATSNSNSNNMNGYRSHDLYHMNGNGNSNSNSNGYHHRLQYATSSTLQLSQNGGDTSGYSSGSSSPTTSEPRHLTRNQNGRQKRRRDMWVTTTAIGLSIFALVLGIAVLVSSSLSAAAERRRQHDMDPTGISRSGGGTGSTGAGSTSTSTFGSMAAGTGTASTMSGMMVMRDAANHLFDELGRYMLEDYDGRPAFADFLPNVAGIYGIPLWSFYCNRGQGIASFGIQSKQYPILEYNAANKAYQNTPFVGFRTFLQGQRSSGAKSTFVVEPFHPDAIRYPGEYNETAFTDNANRLPKRTMFIGANEMQIQEIDYAHGIETNVTYWILPEEEFGALVRRTTVTNTDRHSSLKLSMLDGLAKMEPAGGPMMNDNLKNMGRTVEAWFGVYQPYNDTLSMPYYRLSTQPSDGAAVKIQEAGHYALSVLEGQNPNRLLPIIYDTNKVFGEDTMLLRPRELKRKSIADIVAGPQYGFARTSSAFAALESITLAPGESVSIASFYGKAEHILEVPVISRRVTSLGFIDYKLSRAREMIKQITASVETRTGDALFNWHVQQMYLDNSLRGGIPQIFGEQVGQDVTVAAAVAPTSSNTDEDPRLKVYHLFSRTHGDLERDYNNFQIDPTFFSQGTGHFRDILQNRRNDVIFEPRIASFNVQMFLSFIQADGYEPLSVEAIAFTITDKNECLRIATNAVGHADGHRAQREALTDLLCGGPVRPGQLFTLMKEQNIWLLISRRDFMHEVAAAAEWTPMAVYETGFWSDHWDYYMDLIESYLQIYPDGEETLMYDKRLPYFFSPAFVQPRERKYVLSTSFHGNGKHVRQLDATVEDEAKVAVKKQHVSTETGWYTLDASWQHTAPTTTTTTSSSDATVGTTTTKFKSPVIAKLVLLATIKFATRDPGGMGIEMEAGRPGWNDALNGLSGMIGSGMSETYELKVLMKYIVDRVLRRYGRAVEVPEELSDLMNEINQALDDHVTSLERIVPKQVPFSLFNYWDRVASAREAYRERTKLYFSGKTVSLAADFLIDTMTRWLSEIDVGIARAVAYGTNGGDGDHHGITPSYFSFRVTKWNETGELSTDGHPLVRPLSMETTLFPLFLEGPVRQMKSQSKDEAYATYQKVSQSPLRDHGLGMYTLSESMQGQNPDMGRMMAFSPGWLENQSVWLHMSYKFYLQLLQHGLYDDFFREMSSGAILPFMQPERYGRSLMECSSFIASSAFDDPSIRGRGFLARLSGSTAEFLSMWVWMMIGPNPFFVERGELRMQLVPSIPSFLLADAINHDDKKGRAGWRRGKNDNTNNNPWRNLYGLPHHYRRRQESEAASQEIEQLERASAQQQGSHSFVVGFKLFGVINVEYYSRKRENMYHRIPSRYEIGLRDGTTHAVNTTFIPHELADKIRRVVFVDYIFAYFD